MTEKRFTIDKDGITVIDNCTNGLTECKYSQEAKLLCNFLNEVTEENEQLKSRINELEIINEAQSDAIDGLQETMCHLDLSELNGDVE